MTELSGTTAPAERRPAPERRKLPARLSTFYRQVLAELRKVIWPSRNELVTYTTVVIVFVLVIIAIVAGLDLLFGKLVFWAFG